MHLMAALDESAYAATIVRWLKAMPHPQGSRLTLVHVLEPLDIPDAIGVNGRYRLEQQQEAAAAALLSQARSALEKAYPDTTVVLRVGLPIYEILKLLRVERPDLIVTGTRGLMGAKGLVLGSVSQRLLSYAPCSVLLLPAKAKPARALRVMVATDGSHGSETAARFIAGLPDVKAVTVVSAVRPIETRELVLRGIAEKEARETQARLLRARRAVAHRAAEETASLLTGSVATVSTRVVTGSPGEAIPKAAKRDKCDLLVVGARGLSGMEAVVLGSVSIAIAQATPCPVLIVKASV
jgi:nucleotide-binding universal stress UspA family protein